MDSPHSSSAAMSPRSEDSNSDNTTPALMPYWPAAMTGTNKSVVSSPVRFPHRSQSMRIKQNSTAEKDNDISTTELKSLKLLAQTSKVEIERLTREKTELQSRTENLVLQLDDALANRAILEGKVSKVTANLAAINLLLSQKEQEIGRLRKQVASLKEENANLSKLPELEQGVVKREEQLRDLQSERQTLLENIDSLQLEVEKVKDEKEEVQGKLSEALSAVEALKEELNKRDDNLVDLSSQLFNLGEEKAALLVKQNDNESVQNELKSEIRKLLSRESDLQSALKLIETEKSEMKVNNEELTAQVAALEKRVRMVLNEQSRQFRELEIVRKILRDLKSTKDPETSGKLSQTEAFITELSGQLQVLQKEISEQKRLKTALEAKALFLEQKIEVTENKITDPNLNRFQDLKVQLFREKEERAEETILLRAEIDGLDQSLALLREDLKDSEAKFEERNEEFKVLTESFDEVKEQKRDADQLLFSLKKELSNLYLMVGLSLNLEEKPSKSDGLLLGDLKEKLEELSKKELELYDVQAERNRFGDFLVSVFPWIKCQASGRN